MIGSYFRCGVGAVVREILSEELVLNRIKLGEKPYEVGSSVSDPKNSLYKGLRQDLGLLCLTTSKEAKITAASEMRGRITGHELIEVGRGKLP